MCGIGVPPHQRRQGNQWHHIVNELKLQPATVVISMGGNDVSDFDTKLKAKKNLLKRIPKKYKARRESLMEEIEKMKDIEYKLIVDEADIVLDRLKNHFEGARLLYIATWARPGWDLTSIQLADEINKYIDDNKVHKTMCMFRYLDQSHWLDNVHLNDSGYRVLVDHVFHSELSYYLMPYLRKDKKRKLITNRYKKLGQCRPKQDMATNTDPPVTYCDSYYSLVDTDTQHGILDNTCALPDES